MKAGLFGHSQSGKSLLFKALTTQDPNKTSVGLVKVTDPRIQQLSDIFKPKKTTFAEIIIEDLGHPTKSGRKGIDSKFVERLMGVDIGVFVLGAFLGMEDIVEDFHKLMDDLLIADLELVERLVHRWKKEGRSAKEIAVLDKVLNTLQMEQPAYLAGLDDSERAMLAGIRLITANRLVIVVNHGENDVDIKALKKEVEAWNAPILKVNAQIEAEIAELDPESREEFIVGLGIGESVVDRLVKTIFDMMDLISFFTVGPDEVRAWPIKRGTIAKKAAGKIHSDLEKGFIRAEVVDYDTFIKYKDMKVIKDKGLLRLEGKDYVVKDGDILNIRFNV